MGSILYVDILCFHIFCPQKTHNATLLSRGTCIQGRRHLVTAAMFKKFSVALLWQFSLP
jgi:hypothetical protein